MSKDLEEKLTAVFREVFEDADLSIYPEMTAKEHPRWNSFSHMLLIAAIEKKFRIVFSFEEVRNFDNVGQMMRTINLKTKGG